jgi:RNA polymerase sigma-70 factor (ECF subfamily)
LLTDSDVSSFSHELVESFGVLDAGVAAELDQAFEEARREYPGIAISERTFASFVAARADSAAALLELRLSELYLACACGLGDQRAIATLERRCRPALQKAANRYMSGDVDELSQRVRERVLISRDGNPGKLASYTGRGDFAAWVSVVAVRLALRSRSRPVGNDSAIARAMGNTRADPELAYLKQAYRSAFREAFRHALRALPEDDRALLGQRYVQGLTGREIAARSGVHPATISRRLDQALERLRVSTLQSLGTEMRMDAPEVESVMRLVASHLEASFARYLREIG